MRIAGLYWSRIAGPVVGLALFFLLFRFGGGYRGLILGLIAFLAASWFGEHLWWKQADAEERRLEIEDRVRNPPE
jgi:high-affinity Fe2+/Pb2+ permease